MDQESPVRDWKARKRKILKAQGGDDVKAAGVGELSQDRFEKDGREFSPVLGGGLIERGDRVPVSGDQIPSSPP